MKNRYTYRLVPLLIFSTILLWPFFSGCKKESPPPEKQEVEPKLELSVTPQGEIPYGGGVDIRWTADNNTNKVVLVVNGAVKETRYGSNSRQGAFYVDHLFKDAIITIIATNVYLSVEVEKEIRVGDWTTSKFGLVSKYPWRYDSLGVSSLDGMILRRWSVTPEEKTVTCFFLRGGTMYASDNPGWVVPWYISDENTIVINGSVQKLQVDDKQMIISYQTEDQGEPVWFDMIYEHASDVPNDPL